MTESDAAEGHGRSEPGPPDPAVRRDSAEDDTETTADAQEPADTREDTQEDASSDEVDEPPLGVPGPPFSRRAPFVWGVLAGLGLLTAFAIGSIVYSISSVIVQVVVSLFIAAGINPMVVALERRGMRRGFAVIVVILAVLAGLALFVVALVPVISDQVQRISDNVPTWFNQLENNQWVQNLDDEYHILDKIQSYVTGGSFVSSLFGGVLGVGLAVLGFLVNAFVIIVLTLYFTASFDKTKHAIYSLAPASRRARVAKLGDRIFDSIGGYVSGAFIVAVCAGVSSVIFLFAIGMSDYAVALGFVVMLTDVIPMIGATIGAVIVCLITFASTDLKTGLIAVIFYVIYQQLENYAIYPRVMARSVDVPGLVTVIAALIGASLLGVVGALLAIPTAAAILMIVREVFVRAQDQR
ncbi:MAG: AI-2E family transporter [Nocardioides sp.]|uniref:AI-2E family transporter n=1 Tax=Nocardioides sp. TaxID=35761 RepID=UPI0039E51F26